MFGSLLCWFGFHKPRYLDIQRGNKRIHTYFLTCAHCGKIRPWLGFWTRVEWKDGYGVKDFCIFPPAGNPRGLPFHILE